jgi:hypothetical protein
MRENLVNLLNDHVQEGSPMPLPVKRERETPGRRSA